MASDVRHGQEVRAERDDDVDCGVGANQHAGLWRLVVDDARLLRSGWQFADGAYLQPRLPKTVLSPIVVEPHDVGDARCAHREHEHHDDQHDREQHECAERSAPAIAGTTRTVRRFVVVAGRIESVVEIGRHAVALRGRPRTHFFIVRDGCRFVALSGEAMLRQARFVLCFDLASVPERDGATDSPPQHSRSTPCVRTTFATSP